MVPVLLAAQIIELARNQTWVIEAGASLVPMPNQTAWNRRAPGSRAERARGSRLDR